MKLYLSVNKNPLNGYVHIDPNPLNNNNKFVGDLTDLTSIVYFNECSEIIVEHLLDSVSFTERNNVLMHLYELLQEGGKIIIIGNDLLEVSKSFLIDEINTEIFNRIIYDRKSLDTLDNLAESLKNVGFKIVKQNLVLHQYKIEAHK